MLVRRTSIYAERVGQGGPRDSALLVQCARQTGWQRPDRSRADPFGGDKCQTSPVSLRLPVGPSFPPCLCGSSCGHGGKGTLLSWHAVFVGILERKKKKRRAEKATGFSVFRIQKCLSIDTTLTMGPHNSQFSSTVVKSLARRTLYQHVYKVSRVWSFVSKWTEWLVMRVNTQVTAQNKMNGS